MRSLWYNGDTGKRVFMYRAHITLIVVAAVVIAFMAGWSLRAPESPVLQPYETAASAQEGFVTVTIDYGNGTKKEMPEVPFVQGDSVFTVLSVLSEAGMLELESEDYGEQGMFLVSIDGVGGPGSDRWWQYWVNGTYATLGVSAYQLSADDHVRLVFTNEQNL